MAGGEEAGALSFSKVLSASDVTHGQLTLSKSCGEALFPLVGVTVSVRDVEDNRVWRFKHGLTGTPPRDRLSKEWATFVRHKGRAAGHTVVLTKNRASGELGIRVRRTAPPPLAVGIPSPAAESDPQISGGSSEVTTATPPEAARLSGYFVGEASSSRPAGKRLKTGGEGLDPPSPLSAANQNTESAPSNPAANACSSPGTAEGRSYTDSSHALLRPDAFPGTPLAAAGDGRSSFRLFGEDRSISRRDEEGDAVSRAHGGLSSLDLNLPPPLSPGESL